MSALNKIEALAKESCADAFIAKRFDIDVLERLVNDKAIHQNLIS